MSDRYACPFRSNLPCPGAYHNNSPKSIRLHSRIPNSSIAVTKWLSFWAGCWDGWPCSSASRTCFPWKESSHLSRVACGGLQATANRALAINCQPPIAYDTTNEWPSIHGCTCAVAPTHCPVKSPASDLPFEAPWTATKTGFFLAARGGLSWSHGCRLCLDLQRLPCNKEAVTAEPVCYELQRRHISGHCLAQLQLLVKSGVGFHKSCCSLCYAIMWMAAQT